MKTIGRAFNNLKKGLLRSEDEEYGDVQTPVKGEGTYESDDCKKNGSKSGTPSIRKLFTPKKRRTDVRARRKEIRNRYSEHYNPFDSNSLSSLLLGDMTTMEQMQQQQKQNSVQCAGNSANQSFLSKAHYAARTPTRASPSPLPRSQQSLFPPQSPAYSVSYEDFMRTPTKSLYRSSDVGKVTSSLRSPHPLSSFAGQQPPLFGTPQNSSLMHKSPNVVKFSTPGSQGASHKKGRLLRTPQTEPVNRLGGRQLRIHEDNPRDAGLPSPHVARALKLDKAMEKNGSPVLASRSPNLLQTPSPMATRLNDPSMFSLGKKRIRLLDAGTPKFGSKLLSPAGFDRSSSLVTPPSNAKRRRTSVDTRVVPKDDNYRGSISSTVQRESGDGSRVPYTLRVMVVEARNLLRVDIGFKENTNPYVRLSIDGSEQEQKTSVRNCTTEPTFNQAFVFTVMARQRCEKDEDGQPRVVHATTASTGGGKSKQLVLAVHDHDMIFAHQCIGTVHIDLDDLLQECIKAQRERGEAQIVRNVWTKLEGVQQGEIHLVYQLTEGVSLSL